MLLGSINDAPIFCCTLQWYLPSGRKELCCFLGQKGCFRVRYRLLAPAGGDHAGPSLQGCSPSDLSGFCIWPCCPFLLCCPYYSSRLHSNLSRVAPSAGGFPILPPSSRCSSSRTGLPKTTRWRLSPPATRRGLTSFAQG